MGCCQDSSGKSLQIPRESARKSERPYINLQPQGVVASQEQLMAELAEFRTGKKYEELANQITNDQPLDLPQTDSTKLTPSTVGALALCYLQEVLDSDLSSLETLCIAHSSRLLQNLERGPVDMKLYSLVLLNVVLEEDTVHLKEHLVRVQCFPQLIVLMTHNDSLVRRLTAELAANLYRGDLVAQTSFLACRGHFALVNLLMRDGDDDEVLRDLLNHLLDLVVVSIRQDSNNYVVERNAMLLKQTTLMDALACLNILDVLPKQRACELIEIYDSLKQVWGHTQV